MRVKFWGVRGSTPTPENRNARYGGNTACIEIRLANGTLIILDCGSGLRGLGKSLEREYGVRAIQGYVFLTHFHWDHIQGIPFFAPLYRRGNTFLFHAVNRKEEEMKLVFEGQLTSPFFPVDMSVMAAARSFYDLSHEPIEIQGAVIRSTELNHPQGAVAYRIEADGAVFVLATDTEPGSPLHDQGIRKLAKDADVLVYDAQYTPEQLRGEKKGWGHSSWLEGTRIAFESDVKRLVLFHHDPDNDDCFVDGLVETARREFPQVEGASEGTVMELLRQPAAGERVEAPEEFPVEIREAENPVDAPVARTHENYPAASAGSRRLGSGWVAVFLILAALAAGEIHALRKMSSLRSALEAQQAQIQKELAAQFVEQLAASLSELQRANSRQIEAMRTQVVAASEGTDATSVQVRRTKARLTRLAQEQKARGEALEQEIADKADARQVGALSQDVSAARADLDATQKSAASLHSDLGMERSELGTLIARNHDQIETLRKLGERDYFEFTLNRNRPQHVANLELTLKKANVKQHRFNLVVTVDDLALEKNDRTVNEPIFLYVRGSRKPYEIVVNSIAAKRVKGYVSTPKGTTEVAEVSRVGK